MDYPKFNISNQLEESISTRKVKIRFNFVAPQHVQWTIASLIYQTSWKNPLVHEGLKKDLLVNTEKNA